MAAEPAGMMARPAVDPSTLADALLDLSPDAVCVSDASGTVRAWNPRAESLYGYTADEIIGDTVLRVVPARLLEETRALQGRVLEGATVRDFPTRRLQKNGSELAVSVCLRAVFGADRELRSTVESTRPLHHPSGAGGDSTTDRHDLCALLDNAEDLILRYRLTGTPGFDYASPSVLRITGFTPDDLCGAPPDSPGLLLPRPVVLKLRAMAATGEIHGFRLLHPLCRKDGSTVPAESVFSLVRDEHGLATAVVVVAREVETWGSVEDPVDFLDAGARR